jgi:CheY-like chemotaxis protein
MYEFFYQKTRKKARILIVDDDWYTTKSFSLCLEDSGLFEVKTYNDSVKALSNFEADLYDLVLLDIKMPKMSGIELHDEIKRLDGKVKAGFLSTSYRDYDSVEDTTCFIPKSIRVNELIERIEIELLR